MALLDMLSQTATVFTAGVATTDSEGNVTDTFSAGTDYPARLEQTDSTEVTTGRTVVTSDWKLFLPATATVSALDRVEVDGVTFEVVGAPATHHTPRGAHHVTARLRLVTP